MEQHAHACHIHTECLCTPLSLRSSLVCMDMTSASRSHLQLQFARRWMYTYLNSFSTATLLRRIPKPILKSALALDLANIHYCCKQSRQLNFKIALIPQYHMTVWHLQICMDRVDTALFQLTATHLGYSLSPQQCGQVTTACDPMITPTTTSTPELQKTQETQTACA